MYKNEIDFLDTVEEKCNTQNKRGTLSGEEILDIKNRYKNIPDEYVEYLQCIGWGSFREWQFNVFKCSILLSDAYMESGINGMDKYAFFGDNFAGDFSGFDLTNEKVVEWWHDTDEIHKTGKGFREYIRKKMLMDERGNDIRKK